MSAGAIEIYAKCGIFGSRERIARSPCALSAWRRNAIGASVFAAVPVLVRCSRWRAPADSGILMRLPSEGGRRREHPSVQALCARPAPDKRRRFVRARRKKGNDMNIILPDGSVKELAEGATIADVAASIGAGLAKAALAGKISTRPSMTAPPSRSSPPNPRRPSASCATRAPM